MIIYEEVCVEQAPRLVDEKLPHHVFKLTKTLYGLKQASQE
jgi:hypothetical protein